MNFTLSMFGLYAGITYGFYLRENTNIREGILALKNSFKKKEKSNHNNVETFHKMEQISSYQGNNYSYNNIGPAIDRMRVKDIDKEYDKIQSKENNVDPFKQIFK